MSERVQYVKPTEKSTQHEYTANDAEALAEADRKAQAKAKLGHAAVEGADELLDEIDGILEENALEFVNGYKQKGGE